MILKTRNDEEYMDEVINRRDNESKFVDEMSA